MSQNKTVIPESEYDLQHPVNSDPLTSPDFYRPTGAGVSNGTVIAGNDTAPQPGGGYAGPATGNCGTAPAPMGGTAPAMPQGRHIPLQERVLVGVLFSISRGLLGEVFPIYMGRNNVGSDAMCEIALREQTVSRTHAVLMARCDGYPGPCQLSLSDYGSEHGTLVNNRDCRYGMMQVNDGDVLTLGKHYRLLVRLFDTVSAGLYEDSDFTECGAGQPQYQAPQESAGDFYAPTSGGNNNRTVIG